MGHLLVDAGNVKNSYLSSLSGWESNMLSWLSAETCSPSHFLTQRDVAVGDWAPWLLYCQLYVGSQPFLESSGVESHTGLPCQCHGADADKIQVSHFAPSSVSQSWETIHIHLPLLPAGDYCAPEKSCG